MTDRGLAALAAAIHSLHHHVTIANGQPSPDFDGEFAAAILGERGVFLPDGYTKDIARELDLVQRLAHAEHTIATLRGAYREAADWITAVQSHYVLGPEASPEDIFMVAGERQEAEIATLRAALDRIWRANHVVHSAYDGECEHGFGPPATLCPNNGCPDKELAEAWSAALATAKEAGDVR